MDTPEFLLFSCMVLLLAFGLPMGFMIGPAIRHQFDMRRAPLMPPYQDNKGDWWFFSGKPLKNGREGPRVWRCTRCRCQDKTGLHGLVIPKTKEDLKTLPHKETFQCI